MSPDPLDMPMFYGRIAIATAALTHALFATFIVGSSLIGAACETLGYLSGKARFERLSRHIAFTLIFTTAGVSFLGVTWLYFFRSFSAPVPWWRMKETPGAGRTKPKLLIALSLGAMLMMLTIGWVRETARAWNGYLIYGVMSFDDEASHYRPATAPADRTRAEK